MAQGLLNLVSCALGMNPGKPLKVQDREATRRVGVVAGTFKELHKKGGVKLKMEEVARVVLEEDGSEVEDEDFFQCLKDNTVLIFLRPGEVWHGYISYLKMASSKLIDNISAHKHTMEEVDKFLYDPSSPELSLLVEYVHTLQANVEGETRGEDPEWFEGVQDRHKTKCEVMRDAAKQRIRNYLYKTKEYLDKAAVDKHNHEKLSDMVQKFTKELKKNQYFAQYFDRSYSDPKNIPLTANLPSERIEKSVLDDGSIVSTKLKDKAAVNTSHRSLPSTTPMESEIHLTPCSADEACSLITARSNCEAEENHQKPPCSDEKIPLHKQLSPDGEKPLHRQLCSNKGWFCCEGPFDSPSCQQHHTINPYATKQSRVLFSTWNLDHQIEKSRSVLPSLVSAVTSCPGGMEVNWSYYFKLLFTLENLRLVDIRCHKKCVHGNCNVDEKRTHIPLSLLDVVSCEG